MKNVLFLLGLIFSILCYSCVKEAEVKSVLYKQEETNFRTMQQEFERKNGIQTLTKYGSELNLLEADDELCVNSYITMCGRNTFTVHQRTITFMECPIEVTYRKWQCKIGDIDYLSFQIIGWSPLSRCNKFLKQYSDLYWGGVPGSADELINEMYKYFGNVIESVQAGWLAEINTSPCNTPLVHTSFIARDCYKTCIDWTYSDEGELEFGTIIEKRCATSCCIRTRQWCYENGKVKIVGETKGGLTCIRPVNPQPCPERSGVCSPACNRL